MVNTFVKSSVVLAIAASLSAGVSAQMTDVKSGYDLCWQDSSGVNVKSSGNERLNCGAAPAKPAEPAPVLKVVPPEAPKRAEPAPVAVKPAEKPAPIVTKFAAEELFDLNKDKLSAKGNSIVADAGAKLKNSSAKNIRVVGFADRLGKPAYNLGLSQRRARTVKAGLVKAGVDANKICTAGMGDAESRASKECRNLKPESAKNAKLVECLRQFRRVEITESDDACVGNAAVAPSGKNMSGKKVKHGKKVYKKGKKRTAKKAAAM